MNDAQRHFWQVSVVSYFCKQKKTLLYTRLLYTDYIVELTFSHNLLCWYIRFIAGWWTMNINKDYYLAFWFIIRSFMKLFYGNYK